MGIQMSELKIVKALPPNFKEISEAFDIKGKTLVFTYGDKLYFPDYKGKIEDHLWMHEKTHQKQQSGAPEKWWKRYITDVKFRLSQEVEAYQNQFKYFRRMEKSKKQRSKFLQKIASDLSSRIYGNIIGFKEAKDLIKQRPRPLNTRQ